MSAELKSTVAALQMKVASLEAALAKLVEKDAKREARRAAKKSLPSSPPESETDTSEAAPKKKKKAKKEKDPDAPKKEANAYVKFTIRLGGSKASGEAGVLSENNVSMPAVVQKQFAGSLGESWLSAHPDSKKVDWVALSNEYTDEYLVEQAKNYARPEVSKQSMKSDSDAESESKPKKVRGRPKKVKSDAE
jgi:hypothetical protein